MEHISKYILPGGVVLMGMFGRRWDKEQVRSVSTGVGGKCRVLQAGFWSLTKAGFHKQMNAVV